MPLAQKMTGYKVHQHGVWAFADPELRHRQATRIFIPAIAPAWSAKLTMPRSGHAGEHKQEMQDWGFIDARETTGPSESLLTDRYTPTIWPLVGYRLHRQYFEMYLRGTRPYPCELPPTLLPTEDHLDVFIGRLAQEWINDCDNAEPFI